VSQENVEAVRAVTEASKSPEVVERIARGDIDLSSIDPEIEVDATEARGVFGDVPDVADVYRGSEGFRTFWRRWYEAWRDVQFDVQDYLDAGDEVVVLICNQRQWGRYSGISSEVPPYALVYTIRNGKLVRLRWFPDHDCALKAVGLEE
jgi:ketosteroid isomerase-like protein